MIASPGTIVCWAMGLTQHKHSVATLRDVVNVLLLQGNVGKPNAGVCPVRGHSNVQGDRTMGIFERMPEAFHDALDQRFRIRVRLNVGIGFCDVYPRNALGRRVRRRRVRTTKPCERLTLEVA